MNGNEEFPDNRQDPTNQNQDPIPDNRQFRITDKIQSNQKTKQIQPRPWLKRIP